MSRLAFGLITQARLGCFAAALNTAMRQVLPEHRAERLD
jgi:hypothetical protein